MDYGNPNTVNNTDEEPVKKILTRRAGRDYPCISRQVQMIDSHGTSQTMDELEWQRSDDLPQDFDFRLIPGYFRLRSGRVRYGVSLRTLKRRVPSDRPAGITYYPIGVPQLYTGNAVSLSAPFDMNFDRSLLNDPADGTINQWLLKRLADLTIDMLKQDWFGRFGVDAYLAVGEIADSAIPVYSDSIEQKLRATTSNEIRSIQMVKGIRHTLRHEN